MVFEYEGVKINYEKNAHEGKTVLLLHGWGGDLNSFAGVFKKLTAEGISAINIAFPYDVPCSYGIYDYADLIEKLLDFLNIKKAVITGHSFGGRIAIILGVRGRASELILIDSAGLKPKTGLKKRLKIWRYKRAKRKGRDLSSFGSSDYKALNDSQKQVFTRIVNQHLDELVKDINVPTLILWGKNDKDTPLNMAKKLNKNIKDSALIILNGGHYSYIDDEKFYIIFSNFVRSQLMA